MRKRKTIIRFFSFLIVTILILGNTRWGDIQIVQAASPSIGKKYEFIRYKKYVFSYPNEEFISINNAKSGRKIKDIQIDESVATVLEIYDTGIKIKLVAEGKTNLSFKYGNKTLKTTIYVKDYINPCTQFKIGSRDFKKHFDKAPHFNLEHQKKDWKKKKLSIKVKNGWKLVRASNNGKKVKNKGTVELLVVGKNWTGSEIKAAFKNSETNDVVTLVFGFSGQVTDTRFDYYYDEGLQYNFLSAGGMGKKITIGSGTNKCVYTVTSDTEKKRTVSLKSINKNAKKLNVPLSIIDPKTKKSYKVTGILANAAHWNKNLKSVSINGNVKTIGTGAFEKCSKLSDITFRRSSLTEIGIGAFTVIKKGAVLKVEAKNKKHYKKLKKLFKRSGVSNVRYKYRYV